MMIRFTTMDGQDVFINKYQIVLIEPVKLDEDDTKKCGQDFMTWIAIGKGGGVNVKEPIGVVVDLINNGGK